jgi:hypothetical protein
MKKTPQSKGGGLGGHDAGRTEPALTVVRHQLSSVRRCGFCSAMVYSAKNKLAHDLR